MTDRPTPSEPVRLSDEASETADLLRRAELEFRKTVDESGAWRRMERARRRRAQLSWALAASAAAAGAVVISLGASGLRAGRDSLVLAPEPARLVEPGEQHRLPSVALPPPELVHERARESDEPVPSAPRLAEPRGEAHCKRLANAGKVERAVDCFRDLSRSDGLKAEVALYEAARLTAERLQDPARSLGMLDEHRRRFADGVLRGEMEWLRMQTLNRAGRHDEALAAGEALLATPVGRKMASELHWLRGQILQDSMGDCARAVSEFVALVGEPGERGDDAEMRRAQCLERLGRREDARAAYEQYLRRPEPARAAEARTRLSAL